MNTHVYVRMIELKSDGGKCAGNTCGLSESGRTTSAQNQLAEVKCFVSVIQKMD